MQTARVNEESQRHLLGGQVVRRHIPELLFGVPVNRRLEPIALLLEEISAATLAGAKEVFELYSALQLAVSFPLIASQMRPACSKTR